MFGLVVFALLSIVGGYYAADYATSHTIENQEIRVNAEVGNFQVYANAVIAYRQANPGFTGTVPQTSLSLPPGYQALGGWSNLTLSNGDTYIYGTADAAVAPRLITALGNPVNIGIHQGSILWSPAYGNTGTTVPSSIPQNELVEEITLP